MAKKKDSTKYAAVVLAVVLLAVVLLAVVLLAVIYYSYPPSGAFEDTEEAKVLEELKQLAQTEAYANDPAYTAYIQHLSLEDIDNLAAEQPAIYTGVQPGTYLVVYQGEADGLIVIYDFSAKQIVKIFAVQSIII